MPGRSGVQGRLRRGGCRWAGITGGVAVVAVLAGCGGGGAAKTTAAAPANAAANAAEFGLPEAEIERRMIKVESLIQTCMKAQGFEYVPVDPPPCARR